ncbi:MAG: HemY protein [Bacteroidia bacterium]|jgi:HemY protein
MRKLFAIILFALLLGVGIVALIETDPGYVLVTYGVYTLETGLLFGLLLLTLMVLVVFSGLRLIYRLISGQKTLANWFGNRKAEQARRHTNHGLVSFVEGHWAKARRQLERGALHSDAPLANYLLAARASEALGDMDGVHEFLRAAGDSESEAAAAIDITLAQIQVDKGNFEQALAALEDSESGAASQPSALLLKNKAYQALQDWDGVLGLLPALKKQKLLGEARFEALEHTTHSERLARASADQAVSVWQEMPQRLHLDSGLILDYTSRLMALGEHSSAEKVLHKVLKQQWDSNLVRQYGLVSGSDSSRQLSQAESWLSDHPEDSQLLLALGRLAARDKLWGKARDYFESGYRIDHSPEVCAELGRLLTDLGEPKVAAAYFREGLLLREDRLPELPRPEKTASQSQLLARS